MLHVMGYSFEGHLSIDGSKFGNDVHNNYEGQ